jgi:iron complex transport system substrate-binding protein
MKDAKANYLWADVEGTEALVCRLKNTGKKPNCQILIATGSFNLAEFEKSNPHYDQFDAKSRNVYTFESKLGSTGGTVYYEVAASRPDLVLKIT